MIRIAIITPLLLATGMGANAEICDRSVGMGVNAAIEFVGAALASQIVRCAHLKSSILIAVRASAVGPGDLPERGEAIATAAAAVPEGDSCASG